MKMKRRSAIKTISLGAGYTMTGIGFASFISGCKQEGTISSDTESWSPSFMSEAELILVENILDAFLPTTESSPGAKELKIVQVIDNVVNKLFKKDDQDGFRAGLAELGQRIKFEFKTEAAELRAEQLDNFMSKYMGSNNTTQQQSLAEFEGLDKKSIGADQLPDFYFSQILNTLRSQGISAYFSNETIATEYLSYDPVPGAYIGCHPLSEVGNSWSL